MGYCVCVMKVGLLVLFLFVAAACSSQQAPASVEGCREAFSIIRNEVPLEIGNRTVYLRSLSISGVTEKSFVMASCASIDAGNSSQYMLFSHIYNAEEHQRYVRFVERHRLTDKLLKEDAAGER